MKRRNPVAKSLPNYKHKVVKSKKQYNRKKNKTSQVVEEINHHFEIY